MKMKLIYLSIIISFFSFFGCNGNAQPTGGDGSFSYFSKDNFKDYWYQGAAEISSYTLQQARYGEIHEGHAVMVFVTEDFSKEKQVKLDNSNDAGNDKVPIMKLNFTKKFVTGIYPYSMMQSVFTPVDRKKFPHSLKTTMSAQEWCGHTFTQFNLKGNEYQVKGFSYFESEGDQQKNLQVTWLEDEIWNMIRLTPNKLPEGKIDIIPGSFYLRLKHRDFSVSEANATLATEASEKIYALTYPQENRTLIIRFQKDFPYQILSWEETYQDGWGSDAKVLTTTGKLKKTLKTDYWTKHNNIDRNLRTELGLE